jgi:hypothetical protein
VLGLLHHHRPRRRIDAADHQPFAIERAISPRRVGVQRDGLARAILPAVYVLFAADHRARAGAAAEPVRLAEAPA